MDDLAREAYSVLEDILGETPSSTIAAKVGRLLGEMRTALSFVKLLRDVVKKVVEEERELVIPEGDEASLFFLLTALESLRDHSKLMKSIYGFVNKYMERTIDTFDEIERELDKYCVDCKLKKRVEIAKNLWLMWSKMFLNDMNKYMEEIDDIINRISVSIEDGLSNKVESKKGIWKKVFKRRF